MSDEQPADNRNILQKAGALAKDSLSIFGWSIYYSLSQVTHEFRCYKFGPMNVFMRNSPEFRTTLSKMDEYYEKNNIRCLLQNFFVLSCSGMSTVPLAIIYKNAFKLDPFLLIMNLNN